jgi:hypothetical protein
MPQASPLSTWFSVIRATKHYYPNLSKKVPHGLWHLFIHSYLNQICASFSTEKSRYFSKILFFGGCILMYATQVLERRQGG